MGKKRKIITHPQKFGRKFAAHPAARKTCETSSETVPAIAVVEEVPTPIVVEEKIEIEAPVYKIATKKTTTKKTTAKKKSTRSRKKEV